MIETLGLSCVDLDEAVKELSLFFNAELTRRDIFGFIAEKELVASYFFDRELAHEVANQANIEKRFVRDAENRLVKTDVGFMSVDSSVDDHTTPVKLTGTFDV